MKNKTSIIRRRVLIAVFTLLFLVLAPMIVFYANGNILGEGWNILATGGIYINSMEPGAELYVNGKLKETTGFFTRNYLLKNLKPGEYTVLVKKDGYNDWSNKIKVLANKVSESRVFMLPVSVDITEIKKLLESDKLVGTTTVQETKSNPNYALINSLFDEDLVLEKYFSVISTTTGKVIKYAPGTKENPIKNRHLSIWEESGDIYISWNGSVNSTPRIFCEESVDIIKCQSQLKVYSFESDIVSLDFFPGESEVIIVSIGDKVYAIEAENNPDKKLQILYSGKAPDFRVSNNTVYIQDGDFIGQVEI